MQEEDERKKAKRAALNLLAIQGRHSIELRRKLALRNFSQTAIDYALSECMRLGFLNDADQTESMVGRLQKKGYGPRYIAAKLRSKGIAVSVDTNDQERAIKALLQKPHFVKKETKKQIAALQRRGFDLEAIFRVLQQLAH